MLTNVIDRIINRRHLVATRIAMLAAALALVASPSEAAPQPFRSPAKSIETGTKLVSLPSPGGTVVVARGCDTCDAVTMHVTPTTVYRIGNRDVDLAEFREKALSGSYSMTVHYHRQSLDVLKIRIEAFD